METDGRANTLPPAPTEETWLTQRRVVELEERKKFDQSRSTGMAWFLRPPSEQR